MRCCGFDCLYGLGSETFNAHRRITNEASLDLLFIHGVLNFQDRNISVQWIYHFALKDSLNGIH